MLISIFNGRDVFRWPTIDDGTYKQNSANFLTTMLLPGIPMLEWGEEQAFYVLDSTANNYVFGRQSMSSATAWQDHGCYTVGNARYATVSAHCTNAIITHIL